MLFGRQAETYHVCTGGVKAFDVEGTVPSRLGMCPVLESAVASIRKSIYQWVKIVCMTSRVRFLDW